MTYQSSGNVFSDLGFDAESADNLLLRSDLMIKLKGIIQKNSWSQTYAAKRLNVTQPRVSDLMKGKINLFTIDTLVNMLGMVGVKAKLSFEDFDQVTPGNEYLTALDSLQFNLNSSHRSYVVRQANANATLIVSDATRLLIDRRASGIEFITVKGDQSLTTIQGLWPQRAANFDINKAHLLPNHTALDQIQVPTF